MGRTDPSPAFSKLQVYFVTVKLNKREGNGEEKKEGEKGEKMEKKERRRGGGMWMWMWMGGNLQSKGHFWTSSDNNSS